MRRAKMRNGPSQKVTHNKIFKREDKLKKVDETLLIQLQIMKRGI